MFTVSKINGVTLIFSPMKGFSTAAIGIFFKIGARDEKKNLKGIAHFTEHMLFKGTKKCSYRSIKREIEGRGGMLNGYTSQEVTVYYAQFLKKNIEITLDVLFDMVTNPLFEHKEVEKERNVILEEIKMYNDLPSFRALSLLDRILWGNHPLANDVIGTVDTVKSIKRFNLKKFKEEYYLPSRMVISCVGNFSQDRLRDLIAKKTKRMSDKRVSLESVFPSSLRQKKVIVENKGLDQTHLCLGFRGISYRSKYRFAIELLHVLMGANMSSRLFEEIREKRGLCYDISTDVKKYRDVGTFIIHTGLDKKNIDVAFKCIIRELRKVQEKLVSFKELERAKDYILGQVVMGLERPQGRLFYPVDFYMAFGRICSFDELKKAIIGVDREAIRQLAKKVFDFKRICVTCVGDIHKDLGSHLEKIVDKEA